MKRLYYIILFLITIIPNILLSQEKGYEINIADDSLNIMPTVFIREAGSGCIGIVKKAPLYGEILYYTNYLYTIDDHGDTTNYCIDKEDTICDYYNMIRVDIGSPGYLLSGLVAPLNNTSDISNIFTRLDNDFNIVWEKIYKFDYFYSGWSMRDLQLKDSTFLYACSPQLNVYLFLFKMSYTGDSLTYRVYDGDSAGSVYSLTYNSDSSTIWVHNEWAHYQGTGASINSCIELNDQLEQAEIYHYPEYFRKTFYSKLLPDGHLISGGSEVRQYYNDPTERYITAYKFDETFEPTNSISLTNPDTNSRAGEIIGIDYYYPSSIYLAGTHYLQDITGNSPNWFYVAKLNDTLGLEYEKYIGGDDYYWLFSVVATEDNGVLLAGTRSETDAPMYHRDGYIIKLDSTDFTVGTKEIGSVQLHDAIVYPNPGKQWLYVRTALKDCAFRLCDMQGRQLLKKELKNLVTPLNTDNLPPGSYTYTIRRNNILIESGVWIKH